MSTADKIKKYAPLAVISILSIVALIWGANVFRAKHAIQEARDLMQSGYAALAAEKLDPLRHRIVETKDGCSALIGAYYRARQTDRLQWAAEACMRAGKSGLEAFIALAGVQEFSGRNDEALNILGQAFQRFGPSTDLYYRIAVVQAREKNVDAAVRAFVNAASSAGNNYQILMEALQYCSRSAHWKEASQIANQLRTAPTADPEVKLIIARALRNGGDNAGASTAISEAISMLEQKPDQRKLLEARYTDVFKH